MFIKLLPVKHFHEKVSTEEIRKTDLAENTRGKLFDTHVKSIYGLSHEEKLSGFKYCSCITFRNSILDGPHA